MGAVINTTNFTQDEYDGYLDATRSLVSLFIDADELPNNKIDSLVYMQLIEDRLIADHNDVVYESPGVIVTDVAKRNNMLRYIIYSTAIMLLYKVAQIIREQEEAEQVQYAEFSFDVVLEALEDELNLIAVVLDIMPAEAIVTEDVLVLLTAERLDW